MCLVSGRHEPDQHIRVAGWIFRGRIDRKIDTEIERPGRAAGCIGVVDHRDDACFFATATIAGTSCTSKVCEPGFPS